MLDTIEKIREHQFVGNFHSDSQAMDQIERFYQDESNSISERAEAAHIMLVKGMGCDDNDYGVVSDEQYVNIAMTE